MSAPTTQPKPVSDDPVENIVPFIPLVLPVAGGVLIFLLAFIAVYMAKPTVKDAFRREEH